MDVTSGAGTICPSGAPEVDPAVGGVRVCLLKKKENNLAGSQNFTFRCKDDVLSSNNSLILVIPSLPLSLKKKIPQLYLGLLHTMTYNLEIDNRNEALR